MPVLPAAHEDGTTAPTAGARVVHRVRLGADGPAFDAPADATVLASALAAGLWLDSSCRNGTCRACMRRLEQGQVRYLIEWPGLLAEEKAQGWILPCVACPTSDLVLETPADKA